MQKGYEMLDDSPNEPKKSNKVIIIAIALLLIAGGTAYAVTRGPEKPVATASVQQANDVPKAAPTAGDKKAVDQNNQQTQPTAQPAASTSTPSVAPAVAQTTQTVHFAVDSATLLSKEDAQVQEFLTKVKGGKGKLYIDGFTDNLGSHSHGVTLSEQRAKTIEGFITRLGFSNQISLVVKGNAEENPVGDNATFEGRALNRRVELKFVPNN